MTALSAELIEALAAWDTPALSNALDALRLRSYNAGYTNGSVYRVTGAAPMVGRAVTALGGVPRVVGDQLDDALGGGHLRRVRKG